VTHTAAIRLFAVLLLVSFSTSGASTTQRAAPAASVATRAGDAARAFLATLDERQRTKALLPLNNTTRTVWSNLPTGVALQSSAAERNGLKLGDMSPTQQESALALVAAALSSTGFQKVMNIVNADEQLETRSAPARTAGSRVRFGRAEYYLAILGTPSADNRWMLQFGGHHLGINVTIAGPRSVLTPTHTGAQPANFTLNGQTIRPLGGEHDKAFKLMNALDAAQQKQALLGYEVRNLVLGPGEDGKVIQPEGVRASSFNQNQRAMLLDLIREWVGILNAEAAGVKIAEISANLGDTYFAWSGSITDGGLAYFRIQGPTVLIEYAPQGAPKPSPDHIHTIFRDPTNDYGARLVAR
jgi:type II secretory pathway pseudopilin PulG